MNQSIAISSEKQRCLADVINLLGVVLIRPSGRQSILIYLGPMTSALTLRLASTRPVSYDVIPGQISSGSGHFYVHIKVCR